MAKTKTKDAYEELLKKMKPHHIRFITLYLGGEDGKCFNNATLSYIRAFEIECSLKRDEKTKEYSPEYLGAKSSAHKLLTNADIRKLKHIILLEQGFKPENIKKRFSELAFQNKNLPLAHASTRDIAKMIGIMKDDSKSVDIPQLTELTDHIKKILTQ